MVPVYNGQMYTSLLLQVYSSVRNGKGIACLSSISYCSHVMYFLLEKIFVSSDHCSIWCTKMFSINKDFIYI